MVAIGVDQSLSKSALYEHKCLENINKLYKISGKRDDKHQYKAMIEASMVSKTKECTDNSPLTPNPYVSTKNYSARKLIHQFSKILDVKHKTAVRRIGASKANHKAIKTVNVLRSNITK